MADTTNSPSSIIDEAFATFNNPNSEVANDILLDPSAREVLAVSDRQGNGLTEDPGLGRDLTDMSYEELLVNYGPEVADNQIRLRNTTSDVAEAYNAERDNLQVIGDTVLGSGAAFVGLSGNTFGTLSGAGIGALQPNSTAREGAVRTIEGTAEITGNIRALQSDELTDRRRLNQIEGMLDSEDSRAQFHADIESGQDPLTSAFRAVGRDFFNTGERILSDGAVTGDLIAESVGSLGPSAGLASLGGKLAAGSMTRLTANQTAQNMARTAGIAAAVGASEASGTYADTVQYVMGAEQAVLDDSPIYQGLLQEGYSPEQARVQLASITGEVAFARQLPTAAALGLLSSKFEASPIGVFRGAGIVDGLRTIAVQGIEEGFQGASGQLNQNIAIRDNVDPSIDVSEGVIEQAVTGVIGGIGQSGVTAAPAGALNIRDAVADLTGRAIDAGSAQTFNDPLTQEILGRDSVGTRVANAASSVAAPVVNAVRARAEQGDTAGAQEATTAGKDLLQTANEALQRADTSRVFEAIVSEPDSTPAPSGLDTEGQSFLQNAVNVVAQFSDRNFKPTEAQTAYAAAQFSKLGGMLNDMPAAVRSQAQKLINSPQARKVKEQAASIDLNKTQNETTQVTPDVVSETVSVAKTNPTNVNPVTVDKILKESGEVISDADVRVMQGASNIAAAVNDHTSRQVEISTERGVGLQKVGREAPTPLTQETASRSLRVEGYTDRNGKDLRSINDFASDIFQGAQSVDGSVITREGQSIPVAKVMSEFTNFIEHMNNKVSALNESFQQNDGTGRGPRTGFRGLVGGNRFVEADKWKNPVAYHRGNPNSAHFARQVSNDLETAVKVYNEIRNTFPEQFGSFTEAAPVALLQDEGGFADEATLNAEIEAQQAQELIELAQDDALRVEQGEVLDAGESLIDDDGTVSEASQEAEQETNENTDTKTEENPTALEEETNTSETPVEDVIVTDEQNSDAGIEIDQSDDILRNDDGTAVSLYHGTNADFTTFNDGGIFLTTRKGLAREHARRGGEGTPRLIETNVKLANPLSQQIPDDQDPDAYWLQNALSIETAKAAGGYDSILIFNDKEAMVIADTNDQIIQIDQDVDGTRGDQEIPSENTQLDQEDNRPERKTHESFDTTYQEADTAPAVTSLDDYFAKAEEAGTMNTATLSFAKKLIRPLVGAMNKRIADKQVKLDGKPMPLTEALKGGVIQTFRQYRNTAIVDQETGRYDDNLIDLAGIALVDWMVTATARDPNRVDEALADLGLSYDSVTDEEMQAIMYGLPPAMVKDQLSREVMRMWNVKENLDAPLGELEGIAQGVVSEMLTTLADNPKVNLIDIVDVNIMVDGTPAKTQTIVVKGLEDIQKQVKAVNIDGKAMTARELLFGDQRDTYSIGQKINGVARSQNRSNVQLSAVEQSALKSMQDTPHFMDQGRVELVAAIGEPVYNMFGFVNDAEDIPNGTLRRSVMGKNLSVSKNLEDTEVLLNALEDDQTPVYYPVGITKVGRHQYQGINPQSNKVLRSLVTPTWSELSYSSKEDMDAFWLGVAQASDLFKVEKKAHTDILSTVEDTFNKEYRGAVNMVKDWLATGELSGDNLFAETGVIEPQVLASIHAVAEMEFYKDRGQETFRTSLSFELDGLTNGAANMMVNYGQGEITKNDYANFNRIGLFLGALNMTVNKHFATGDIDLYETTSRASENALFGGLPTLSDNDKARMLAAGRFAARFGNFTVTDDGSFEMTRNTAKNPMTKVNYGSGVAGVGSGIADDMVLEFYRKTQDIPANVDLEAYFAYPGIQDDIRVLFGDTLPADLAQGAFEFPASALEGFRKNVSDTIGTVLTESTKTVIGDKITQVNDMLVFSTNVQSQYLQLIFADKLAALAETRAKAGQVRRQTSGPNKGKPIMADLSRRDYQSVVKELQALSPIFVSDEQTLAIGGFDKQTSDLVLSSNMDGRLNQKASLPFPEEVKVRAIPYSVIGSGDAMMMNFIFGSEGAPKDALGIFDGLDVPVGKVKEYAPFVNQQVLKTWDRDVLAMAAQNYSGFVKQVGAKDPILMQAFQMVKDKSKKTTVVAATPSELVTQLDERHRQNKARKAVLKRIPVSVDQMGGSDIGFSRGEGAMPLSEINRQIQAELDGRTVQKEEDVNIEIQETTADAVLKGMRLTSDQKKVVDIVKGYLPETRVIIGTISQLNAYRQENFPDDGQFLEGNAQFDSANNTIFLASTKPETIIHEMVHAATYGRVLDHYTNTDRNEAVTRLEGLMNEFLSLETTGQAVNEAKASILRQSAQNDPASKAAAVNEFMAYALSNKNVGKVLKDTETKTLAGLAQKVIQLMRRIMGGVPTSMFDQVVFNTKVLNEAPIDDGDNGNGNGNDGTGDGPESTPEANAQVNRWVRLAKELMEQASEGARDLKKSARPAAQSLKNADDVVDGFRQVGMLSSAEDRQTFVSIYAVMAADVELNPNALIALNKVFNHIETEMTPEMFGSGPEANQAYSAVLSSLGSNRNGEVSDAVAVMVALSQTSKLFRSVLDQIPEPTGDAQTDGSLSGFMSKVMEMGFHKVMGTIGIEDQNVQKVLDQLANDLVMIDQRREFRVLNHVTASLSAADAYVSGKMSELSEFSQTKNAEIKASTRSKFVKSLSNAVTLGTNLLDKRNSGLTADAAKRVTHTNTPILSLVPIRELVSEMIGTDNTNRPLVALMDEVNSHVSGMRQAYREDLPGILQGMFKESPSEEQWSSMHVTLGQTDITRFMDTQNMQSSMSMLEESGKRRKRIQELEQALEANLLPYVAQDAKDKAQQLADFMNGQGAGKLLMRNAYAIAKNLDGNFNESMVEVIDQLVSMYVIDQMDADVREETVQLWQNDPKGIVAMVTYIQGLNSDEDAKFGISEQARLNGYKGFIPNHGQQDVRIIIANDADANDLAKRGYQKLGAFEGDVDSVFPRSYFVTNTRQGGAYSQGIMQNVQSTYRGVDINTGMSVGGATSGFITDDNAVEHIIGELNSEGFQLDNNKETLLPVFDEDGTVAGFERAINPDVFKAQTKPEQNLAVMLGAWAGRHVEESLADEYNRTLLDHLNDIYQNRENGTDSEFVNLKKTSDPIYKEAFSLWPQGSKQYADSLFDGEGPMVRKDQVNLSTGYREASLADMWSGKTRLPAEVQKTVVGVSQFFMGKNAMRWLSTAEQIGQGIVSSAKDIIVIRSLVVPMANTKANVIQLATRGVPVKQIYKGFRGKLAEIEEYNRNVTKRIELEAKLRLAANNANQRRIVQNQIQVIDDLNARMSIAPLIAAGAYKNLSEGITDLDVDITKGRIGDIVESLANRLPESVANVAKVGLVSKSTKIYQVANRATQYGDFLAKSIYYDHLFAQGLSHDEAVAKMNEEFVNFSALPGRTRSYLETVGLTWFMAFKLRIAKIAMQQLRENPVRALAVNAALPDVGSPIGDNILSVIAEDRLDYSTGYEMLFSAPELNPWVNLMSN